ncbi:MAG: PilZ domain-containing protein [Proteobacteria bacterium]|jgi:type IV pilus assembly protein PilZ|nr:PilZ domain-containing protein [Pseudomonadota bacterium]
MSHSNIPQPRSARPSVLSMNIGSKAALYAAYMPYLIHGGIFLPTTKHYALGDEVFLMIQLMDDPAKYPVAGTVVWITPAGAQRNKAQGVGVQLAADETGKVVKQKIEQILAGHLNSSRPTHTL